MIYLTAIVLTPGGSSTHLHTNNSQDTENRTYITIKKLRTSITIKKVKTNLGSAGRYTLAFALQPRKKHENPSVRVAARTSQADTVQYTEEK
jgi:hypothetical protein